ncbi:MAG: peptide ABC transporter substrate-binding protein [Candidatus Spechtbacterales bacterium]
MRKPAVFLAVFMLVLSACTGGSPDSVSDNVSDRDFLQLAASEPNTLDPHLVTDVGSHRYTSNLYGNLLRLDPALYDADGNLVAVGGEITQDMIEQYRRGELTASAEVVADLAESIPDPEYNDDGTVSYTFTLRENVRFSSHTEENPHPVTAWDVAYSIERAADPDTRSTTAELYLGDILGIMDMQYGRIDNRVHPDEEQVTVDLPGIEVVDERTIKLTADGGIVSDVFLMKLTYPTASVVDKVQAESAARWTHRPNATGPYVLVKRDASEIIMEANPNYHGDKPKIDKVVYKLASANTFQRYQAGEFDLTGVGVEDLDMLAQVRDLSTDVSKQYFETPDMATSYIGLNNIAAPFDDPLVRRAFALAFDRKAIAETVLQDLVVPAYGILPPGIPGYRDDFRGQDYDPDEARRLLAESSYAGNMPRIKLTVSGSGSSPSVVLQSIVENWRTELGVDVEFEQVDYATFLEELNKGSFQAFSLGWVADYPDPEDFLDLKFHSLRSSANNETRYSNPEVDALLEEARVERDPEKRIALYHKAEEMIAEDAPWIVLFHSKNSVLVKPYLCGYMPTPMAISIIRYVSFCES